MIRILFSILLFAVFTNAKPMPPFPVLHVNSDGDSLFVQYHGDENGYYTETTDGYLLFSDEKGDFYYANDSALISNVKASANNKRSAEENSFLNALDKESVKKKYIHEKMNWRTPLNYGTPKKSTSTKSGALQKPSAGDWSLGEKTFLVILVNHSNGTWTHTKEEYEALLNEEGYNLNGHFGSVRDYFIRQSGGLFKPTFRVIGPYDYPGVPLNNDNDVMQTMLDAAFKAGDLPTLSDLPQNKEYDGLYHPFVGLVLAGNRLSNGVSTIYMYYDMKSSLNGVKVGRYIYIPELSDYNAKKLDGMGTFTHEFLHVLGLPDLYETKNEGTHRTLGYFDVMDIGCYNGSSLDGTVMGTQVPNLSSFEREWLGWHTPTEISSANGVYAIPSFDSTNFAYSITTPSDSDQWFVLENRQKINWDAKLPGHGLLIWHIDYDKYTWNKETVNSGTYQYVDIEEASIEYSPYNGYTYNNQDYYTFPGSGNITSFDNFTDWNGDTVYSKISNIVEENGWICFSVGDVTVETCPPVDADSMFYQNVQITENVEEHKFWLDLNIENDKNYPSVYVDISKVLELFGLSAEELEILYGTKVLYYSLTPEGTLDSTVSAEIDVGNFFDASGHAVESVSDLATCFSQILLGSSSARIVLLPTANDSDTYTIKQALRYKTSDSLIVQATIIFKVNVLESSNGIEKDLESKQFQTALFEQKLIVPNASKVQVFDLQGHLVYEFKVFNGEVNLQKLSGKNYIVRVQNENGTKAFSKRILLK